VGLTCYWLCARPVRNDFGIFNIFSFFNL